MRCTGVVLLVMATLGGSGPLSAATVDDVRQAVETMDNWLGEGVEAEGWRAYLRHDELLAELDRGAEANRAAVAAILARFRREAAGLELAPFAAVRGALQRWADELQISPVDHVAASLNESSATFVPLTDEQIRLAKSRVIQAAGQLQQFLARGSAENAAAWKDYLWWDELQQQLTDSAQPDPEQLGAVAVRYFSGQPGLELVPFVELRESLLGYRRLLLAHADADMQQWLSEQLTALREALQGAEEHPATAAAEMAARLNGLEQLGQVPDLVERTRSCFARPNLFASVSAEMIATRFSEPVAETLPVRETILGVPVRGQAYMSGNVAATLIPSDDTALVELTLSGTTTSNTIGYRPPVTIHSHGITQVLARKRLLIEPLGVRSEPAAASCSTSSRINHIGTSKRLGSQLIQRIAWKQVCAQKRQAERVSARLAEARVARRMDQQTLDLIASSNGQLESKIRKPLRRRNLYPRWLRLRTTNRRLYMTALQGRRVQLAAPTTPPDSPETGVMVQAHESFFQNTAQNAIGGVLITDLRAQELVKEVTGEVPEQLRIKPDEDPWSITFDRTQPLTLRFDGDQVTISLRGREFTRGDQVLRQVMQIAATYQVETVGGRVRLTRQGDIDVSYPGRENERLSLQELGNKTFMTGKFEGLFKPEISGEGVELPERWQRLGDLSLDFVAAQGGWLSLGWN